MWSCFVFSKATFVVLFVALLLTCLSIILATNNQAWRSFASLSTAPRTMKTHLEVFRPTWWIVWIRSMNLRDLGPLRYFKNRQCGAQASHPRSYLLLWSRQCIVVEVWMILHSARTVWLWLQRDDDKQSCLKWTRNHFLLHNGIEEDPSDSPGRFYFSSPRSGRSLIKVDVLRTWSPPESFTVPSAIGKIKLSPFIGVNTSFALSLFA